MDEARDRILQLRDELNNVYAGYLHQNDERLGQQARALAPYLPKALAKIYKGLGDDWDSRIQFLLESIFLVVIISYYYYFLVFSLSFHFVILFHLESI